MNKQTGVRLATLALLVIALQPAEAAFFCVGTSTELQNALMTAASNGTSDTIQVRIGTYTGISSIAFAYNTAQNFDLILEGGYQSGCGARSSNPGATVLSGSGVRKVLQMTGSSGTSGAMRVDRLTVRDGVATERGGGLLIGGGGFAGDIVIERVYVDNNAAQFGGGLSIGTDGRVTVRNSLFRSNSASQGAASAEVLANAASAVETRVQIGNNTVFGGQCTGGCTTGGMVLTGNARFALFNNLFAMNDGNDIQILTPSTVTELAFNNINQLSGTPDLSIGNLNFANPQFVDFLSEDFRLEFGSPMRNAGTGAYDPGILDFSGLDRVNDGQIDIGAFENAEVLFKAGFETLM